MDAEERRIEKANRFLEQIDQQIDDLIIKIEMERDLKSNNNFDTEIVTSIINELNAIEISDDEDTLIAIGERYDEVVEKLNEYIVRVDSTNKYKSLMEKEKDKIISNRSEKFDPIAETYKEISSRLEKGEIQSSRYRTKIKDLEGKIEAKEEEYQNKDGNIPYIKSKLEKVHNFAKECHDMKLMHDEMRKLTITIDTKTQEINTNSTLSDEQKAELQRQIEEKEQERSSLISQFTQFEDKDGNKFEKQANETDKDYIGRIVGRVQEKLGDAIQKFNDEIYSNISNEKSIYTRSEDGTEINIKNYTYDSFENIEDLMEKLSSEQRAWEEKKIEDGYNRSEIDQTIEDYKYKIQDYQNMANVPEEQEEYSMVPRGTSFAERYSFNRENRGIIGSFFRSLFRKNAVEREMSTDNYQMMEDEFDIDKTKKHVLKKLSKNRDSLEKMSHYEKNQQSYKDSLRRNVRVSQDAVNKFWDEEEATRNQGEEER